MVALALRPGDEVITSPISFAATASAIVLAGGVVRFADVDPRTFVLTPETVKREITGKTKAILYVHLFGASVGSIQSLSQLGLPVVEDACQAVGGETGKHYAGTCGIAGAYSFGGRKQVTAGEGGMLVTNSDTVARSARLTMNHGECFGGPVGYNYRPNEATCKLILAGLKRLKDNTPFAVPYLVKKRGPNDKPYIDRPLYELPAFQKYKRGNLPVAEELTRRTLCVR